MRVIPTCLAALVALGLAAPAGKAQTIVLGTGLAATCSRLALAGEFDQRVLATCNQALTEEVLGTESAAKTYVNRGVVHLRRASYDNAVSDFARAERLMPRLGEIYINRGVVFLKQQRWTDALAEFDRGIALAPEKVEIGLFNRALAKEQIDDFQGAYVDFRKAQEIAPKWEAPRRELQRYTVRARS